MSEKGRELAMTTVGGGAVRTCNTHAGIDREQTGVVDMMSAIRREEVDRSTPDGLRQTIAGALDELRAHSRVYECSDFPPSINAVDALLMEIAECIETLHIMGEPVPMIDVTGINESLLMAMPEHPLLQHLGRILEQQRYKARLVAKWGRREERMQNALPAQQRRIQSM
ncbi:MAG: hypothetical protein PHH13_04890 [Candidatus Peribacteraceae bacterium]|nr:hypothetical protein [Candidatus Peribacteraceae bacterium]